MILQLAVINIPAKVGRAAWKQCFEQTAARAEIFGINETFTIRQRRLYRRLAKTLGLLFFALFIGPNPIFYDRSEWRRVAGSQHRLHGRGPRWRTWPGFNAARYATAAVFDRRDDLDLPWVTVINTHWVPRGPKVPAWWRERARKAAIAKVEAIIDRHLAIGRIVVLMGDLNMGKAPELDHIRWIRDDAGVDELGIALPDGWHIVNIDAARYAAPTDHGHGTHAAIHLERIGEAA